LRGALRRQGIACDVRYLQFPFAAQVGQPLYDRIAAHYPSLLLGEWLFAHHLFGDQLPDPQSYVNDILREYAAAHGRKLPEDRIAQLPRLRALTGPYLEACMAAIPWEQYAVVGFSSTFAQNIASLALARRIKETWPNKIIVFGGANCEGEMGAELHRQFPFVDYVCSGESDLLFPALIERLGAGGKVDDLPGLVYRRDGETVTNGSHALPIINLDDLPLPDYDDYFAQLEESDLVFEPEVMRLLLETSRGCWWGAKSQCVFCGLNSNSMTYRSKSSARVLEEFTTLARRYPAIKFVDVVDNILDVRYFRDVIPELIERDLGLSVFYEVKANLSKEQLRLLKQAGIRRTQPGIESLDSDILQLMRKGCTTTQNVQLLKWAHEVGIYVDWNIITGFPGEDPAAYQRMAEMIPALVHLQPPISKGGARLRLDRFSPYFQHPEAYGMVHIRSNAAYHYVYPFSEESLASLAYFFDFDYADGRQPETYTDVLNGAPHLVRYPSQRPQERDCAGGDVKSRLRTL
jgi:ribosomal peptide maturation radical SAM protein 1